MRNFNIPVAVVEPAIVERKLVDQHFGSLAVVLHPVAQPMYHFAVVVVAAAIIKCNSRLIESSNNELHKWNFVDEMK